jgi:hypothetical protein
MKDQPPARPPAPIRASQLDTLTPAQREEGKRLATEVYEEVRHNQGARGSSRTDIPHKS